MGKTFPPSIYWIILLYFKAQQVVGQDLCGTHEEGKTMTLSCTSEGDAPFESLEPRFLIDGAYQRTASCDSNGTCTTTDQERYTALFEKTYNKRKVSLHVGRVDRHMTTPRCYRDGEALYGVECHIQIYVRASKPVCEGPRFVDRNTSAVYTCTSERVYPSGKCQFILTSGDSKGLRNPHYIWKNTNSSKHEGDKAIDCQLKIDVGGSEGGTYRFRVGITPDIEGITERATVFSDELIPLTLSPLVLFNHFENGHVFSYPDNGYLHLEIHVTGNPWPNRVSLSVRYGESSGESLLSKDDYAHEYLPSVDSVGCIISLNITGGLHKSKMSHFTLKAHNGVLEEDEFEYNFSVGDANDRDKQQETGLILGLIFAVLFVVLVVGVVIHMRRSKKSRVPGGIDNQMYDGTSPTSDYAYAVHYTASPYLSPSEPVPPPYREEQPSQDFINVYEEPANAPTTSEAPQKPRTYR